MQRYFCFIVCIAIFLGIVGCDANKAVSKRGNDNKNSATNSQTSENKDSNISSVIASDDDNFKLTISFAGDMVLAGYDGQPGSGTFESYYQNNSYNYFLSKVSHIFKNDDFTVSNLENVMSDRENLQKKEKNYSPAFWFKSGTERIKILSESGVDGVTLNNNHTYDYGTQGYNDTIAAVESAGMQYGSNGKIIYFEKEDFKVAVVCVGLWYSSSANTAIGYLNAAKENSDYQIVMFHGGTEKIHEPEEWKKSAARQLVDAGADLVVGSHPHVLQPREIYNGVEIVYSLGNFCYGGSRYPENRTIIYQMTLEIDKNKQIKAAVSDIIPCYVHTGSSSSNFQPAIIEDAVQKQKVIDFMNGEVESPI
ncbi:MAG: CapA family protein [Clostridia bacterium]|nr:CapA family protein [Clostridia bacterium]